MGNFPIQTDKECLYTKMKPTYSYKHTQAHISLRPVKSCIIYQSSVIFSRSCWSNGYCGSQLFHTLSHKSFWSGHESIWHGCLVPLANAWNGFLLSLLNGWSGIQFIWTPVQYQYCSLCSILWQLTSLSELLCFFCFVFLLQLWTVATSTYCGTHC